MANSYGIIRIKQQLQSLLINNEEIVRLINAKEEDIETPDDLISTHIFNYIRIPESPEEAKTYIAFEIDVPDVYSINYLFKKLVITFYIISAESLMPTNQGATRIDLISAEIDKMLNGYDGIGLQPLELISNTSGGIGVKHRHRIMTFATKDLSSAVCD